MHKSNIDLRLLARGKGVPLWKIADRLGVSDQTLFRQWREELSDDKKKEVIEAIEFICQQEAIEGV